MATLAEKLGKRGAASVKKHQTDETTFGQVELPGGIEHGIAQLVDCKFSTIAEGKQNAGEFFFFAAGIVQEPKEIGGIKIGGLRTSIMEVICDTPTRSRKTVEEHLAWVMNEMAKLGVDRELMVLEDLEELAEGLKESEEPVYFRFRTWQGTKQDIYKKGKRWHVTGNDQGSWATEAAAKAANPFAGREPRVNHQWSGEAEWTPTDDDDAVVDETVETDEAETEEVYDDVDTVEVEDAENDEVDFAALGEAADAGDEEAATTLGEAAEAAGIDPEKFDTWVEVAEMLVGEEATVEEESEEEGVEEVPVSEMSFAQLGKAADAGEDEALDALSQAAEDAGIDADSIATWVEVAEALEGNEAKEEGGEEEGEETEEEGEAWQPEKDEIYSFKPKGARKAIQAKISLVSVGKEVCNLRSIDDNKVFKNVPWSRLIVED